MKISKRMTLKDFAVTVAKALEGRGIDVVLTGGAVVSIYSKNEYESKDLDFLSQSDHPKISEAMFALGFKSEGKDFYHADSKFYMKPEGELKAKGFKLKLLSPTQCVMDRLAAYYYWNDKQSLDQVLLVAKHQPVNIGKIKNWSQKEGMAGKFEFFREQLREKHK